MGSGIEFLLGIAPAEPYGGPCAQSAKRKATSLLRLAGIQRTSTVSRDWVLGNEVLLSGQNIVLCPLMCYIATEEFIYSFLEKV